MNHQNLFIGFNGIKTSLSNIEEMDFSYQFLSDSDYTIKGYKKWDLKNGKKDISVFYNPKLKILKIEGNPLYYYQGHNFSGNFEIYISSIIKISEDIGVYLFIGIVEYFEFGVICLTPHGTKLTIAAHFLGKGLIKSEITKNGYLVYYESKLIDIKLGNLYIVTFVICIFVGFVSYSTPKRAYKKPTYETIDANIKVKTKCELQCFLESLDVTVNDTKKNASFDTKYPVDKIIVDDYYETYGEAIYDLTVCGEKMRSRRTGSVFFKDGEDPLSKQKKSTNSN